MQSGRNSHEMDRPRLFVTLPLRSLPTRQTIVADTLPLQSHPPSAYSVPWCMRPASRVGRGRAHPVTTPRPSPRNGGFCPAPSRGDRTLPTRSQHELSNAFPGSSTGSRSFSGTSKERLLQGVSRNRKGPALRAQWVQERVEANRLNAFLWLLLEKYRKLMETGIVPRITKVHYFHVGHPVG